MADSPNQILEATQTFITQIANGRGGTDEYPVYAGRTRVTASHILARMYPQHFRPVEEGLSYGAIEEMTDEPGSQGRARRVTPPAAAERQTAVQQEAQQHDPAAGETTEAKPAAKAAKQAGQPKSAETKGLTTQDLRPGAK